jgi:hypothetical protein
VLALDPGERCAKNMSSAISSGSPLPFRRVVTASHPSLDSKADEEQPDHFE